MFVFDKSTDLEFRGNTMGGEEGQPVPCSEGAHHLPEDKGDAPREGRAVHAPLQMSGIGSANREGGESSMGISSQGRLPGTGGTHLAHKEWVVFAWYFPGMN